MGTLATKVHHFDIAGKAIRPVLEYFDQVSLRTDMAQMISLAADLAFGDDLLLEKFQMWNDERDDETFLYHINRFFEKRNQKPLPNSEQDLTSQRELIEASIKETVRNRQKQIFSQQLAGLAVAHNLLTNEQLGAFLGVSSEQARKFKSGENKPQLATLKMIADKFKVTVEFLVGLESK